MHRSSIETMEGILFGLSIVVNMRVMTDAVRPMGDTLQGSWLFVMKGIKFIHNNCSKMK